MKGKGQLVLEVIQEVIWRDARIREKNAVTYSLRTWNQERNLPFFTGLKGIEDICVTCAN